MPALSPPLAVSHEPALWRSFRPVRLRAFGLLAADLEPDFESEDRPALVTALLAACSTVEDAAPAALQQHWWQASVSSRIAALLDLMVLSAPAPAPAGRASSLSVTLRCEQGDCGARFDVDVPAQAWARADDDDETLTLPREGGEPLLLRRPNGADLQALRAPGALDADPASLAQALLQRLCLAGTPPVAELSDLAAALAQADPLVDFSVHCACPECGTQADRAIDLEGQALQALALQQRALLRQVHLLATHYGWTEVEIFAVPAVRRRRYLEAIAAAATGEGTS